MTKTPVTTPRCAALVGPYLTGKTTLLESLLTATGAIKRRGAVKDGNTVGDASPEARSHQASTELTVASTTYLGEPWTFIDCPGSIELAQEAYNGLMVADIAVVVCEPAPSRVLTLAPLLKFLDTHQIPHVLFINKMDASEASVKEMLESLQTVSDRPLVLREIPLRDGERITGHVDLVSERAFEWKPGTPSELIAVPDSLVEREREARAELLETLADFDDGLLEELLEDVAPSTEEIYTNLVRDLQDDLIVPVFFGSAENMNGIQRLLKALRHETPGHTMAGERLAIELGGSETKVQVFKTLHAGHAGKLSLSRVWQGLVKDGMTLNGERVSGVNTLLGQNPSKAQVVHPGAVVSLGRMDKVATGDLLTETGKLETAWPDRLPPLFSMAIHASAQTDEVKLSVALAKLVDEDPSLTYETDADTGELLLWGQGETHLQIARERLENRYGLTVKSTRPMVPYKETIRKPVSQHARHKKQSGGHGEYGDVHLQITPLPRGSGFDFADTITGGVVPKQYIPAVKNGVKTYLGHGPLGFPVVDVSVTLTDGQFHSVDSSDMAFKKAAAQAMREGMPKCNPVLLEPIHEITITLPNEFTSKAQRLVSGRRGHIMGFDTKGGWNGWDEIKVQLPQSEIYDLIAELRSMTMGVGSFEGHFDHLQEFTGKLADQVIAVRSQAT